MSALKSRRPRTPEEFIAAAELPESPAATTSSPAADPASSSSPSAGPRPRSDAAAPADDGEFPWEAAWVRPEVVKLFNLRLPEPYKLKLDWLRARTRIPTHELLLGLILPGIDAEVDRVLSAAPQKRARPTST